MQNEKNNIIDTIVAPATPPGRGGIAVIRLSGPLVRQITTKLIGKNLKPRYAAFVPFLDQAGDIIDEGIALFFPNPHSFTGEDVLEVHGHGGLVVVDRLIRRILSLGARLAKPGEFSERAFLNNKCDLIQAEAISDLIEATSEDAARAAIRSLQGEFSRKIKTLVDSLIHLRVYVEAAIDFSEEEIDFLGEPKIMCDLDKLIQQLHSIKESATQGCLLREGVRIVIAGRPNVGKSSLLNCLSGKDIAIVTEIAGTTRDVLREHIEMDGLPVQIIDTAGLRESSDLVEQEGIRRAHQEIANADFVLHVVDARENVMMDMSELFTSLPRSIPVIIIRNKIDLTDESPKSDSNETKMVISLSAKTGNGISLLKNHIKFFLGMGVTNEGVFSARARHIDALTRAEKSLLNGKKQLLDYRAGELLAFDLRQAQLALNEITGEFSSDDLLGRIFSSFCIGK